MVESQELPVYENILCSSFTTSHEAPKNVKNIWMQQHLPGHLLTGTHKFNCHYCLLLVC